MQSDRSLRLRAIKIDLLKIVKLQFLFEKQTTTFIYFAFVDEHLELALRSCSCFIANQRLGREMVLVNSRTKRSENSGTEAISTFPFLFYDAQKNDKWYGL